MTRPLAIVFLVILWAAITGSFNLPNLLLGAALASGTLLLLRDRAGSPRLLRRLRATLRLAGLFAYELLLSAIKVSIQVMSPQLHLRPGIVAVPLDLASDVEITLLANLITLTPGTLSVDVSDDGKLLYVHALDVADRDQLVAEIKSGFETRVREVFA